MRRFELLFAATCLVATAAQAQQFLNGDFETNTFSGCAYNQSNTNFNAGVPGCVAYGTGGVSSGEIDVMDGPCANYGPAGVVGACCLGLAAHNPNGVDALTLELSTPLVVGASYTITYWGFSPVLTFSMGAGQIEIGTSPTAGAQGTVIGTSPAFGAVDFESYSLTFTATSADSFISVQGVMIASPTWIWIDGFSIQPAQTAFCQNANGNGVNVQACTCLTPPIIGNTWVLDVTPYANTLFSVAYVANARAQPVDVGFGEILISPPVAGLGGSLVHTVGIPSNMTLIGYPLHAQALLVNLGPVGLELELTNGQIGILGL